MKYYQTFDDFIADMNLLFDNFIKFRGTRKSLSTISDLSLLQNEYLMLNLPHLEHKMHKICEGVRQRFDKFVEKARTRVSAYSE